MLGGGLRFGHTYELALEDRQHILAVNLTGTFPMCCAALPHLLASHRNIVNMSSNAAHTNGEQGPCRWRDAFVSQGGAVCLNASRVATGAR